MGGVWLAEGLSPARGWARVSAPRFKLGAISDGISEDFEVALKVLKGYGLGWVEIRNVWGIYNTEASSAQIRRIKELFGEYEINVSAVDTALFKCTLPGTKIIVQEKDIHPYDKQMDLLKRAMDRAHAWGTDKLRCFTFWRVADYAAIEGHVVEEMEKAAELARQGGMRLVIEDEGSCNVGAARELARFLNRLKAVNVGAAWDVGNGYWHGEVSFPDGYALLDPKRIWHVHAKGVACDAGLANCRETFADQGQIDLAGQLRALLRDDYQETISLECEFEAPGMSHEQTTRRSIEGFLKVVAKAESL
jgi:sugar phosphate isomerase/epimerase